MLSSGITLGDQQGVTGSPGPAEQAVTLFEVARVRHALAQLPKKQSEVVLLAHYQGLPYGEIAEILGIPVGTVKSRNFNAMRNLVRVLKR
jgi:RNA polymerase sigma-70 factor, ECF subfamily